MPTLRRTLPCFAVCVLACGSEITPPSLQVTDADVADVVEFITGTQASMPSGSANFVALRLIDDAANVQAPVSNTLQCPAGGTTVVTGTVDRTPNQTTRTTAVTWSVTAAHDNCGFSTPQRSWTITSGTINASGSSTWAFPSSPGGDPTLQALSMTRTGSVVIAAGNQSRTCGVSLQTQFNAADDTFSTTGTVCEREVSNSSRPRGGLGS